MDLPRPPPRMLAQGVNLRNYVPTKFVSVINYKVKAVNYTVSKHAGDLRSGELTSSVG